MAEDSSKGGMGLKQDWPTYFYWVRLLLSALVGNLPKCQYQAK